MKPILLITGVPHSFTSVVSSFLLDHGALTVDLTDNDQSERTNYRKYESQEFIDFTKKRLSFRNSDLTDFFKRMPEDRIILLKYPLGVWVAEEIQDFTDRPVKVVYVMRNPQDIIISNMEKSKTSFVYNFERNSWLYAKMASSPLPTYTLVSERLLRKDYGLAKNLLDFCELDSDEVSFATIDSTKIRSRAPKYVKYRFWNFLWKRLSFFFTVYE